MEIEDILSYIETNATIKQKLPDPAIDSKFLSILAKWVKFDCSGKNWQDHILACMGGFPALMVAPESKLRSNLNLLEKDIATIQVFYEAVLRLLKEKIYACDIIEHKESLIHYLIALLSREAIEHFFVYFLDQNRHIIAEDVQSTGTVNTTSIYIREIARYAFKYEATSLILVHNHPTGTAFPSENDKNLTRFIAQAFHTINIQIADHLIIGNGSYYSFKEQGLLND